MSMHATPFAITADDARWLATPSVLAQGAAQGVSLAKPGDRPNGVVMITSVGEEDYRARLAVDVAHGLPRGFAYGLDCNDLRALSLSFRHLAH